jgi:hypothetical protein
MYTLIQNYLLHMVYFFSSQLILVLIDAFEFDLFRYCHCYFGNFMFLSVSDLSLMSQMAYES